MINKLLLNYIEKIKHKNKITKIYKKFIKDEKVKVIYTHKNNIFVVYKKKENIFRKFTIHLDGCKKIKNDYQGLRWYCLKNKINSKKIISKFYKKGTISYLDTYALRGKKLKSWGTLNKNYNFIKRSLYHYKNIFNYKKKAKIHGDLTLENIFFEKKKIFFLDWEFFNSKHDWGYDAVYLVLSSVSIPYIVDKKFSNKDKLLFKKLWKILHSMPIKKNMLNNPFNYFIQVINKNVALNRSRLISKNKFFPLITPKNFQKKIVKIINTN